MIPKSIVIQGFKSFAKKQVFNFPEKAGFYFLTGKNELEPALEANGAGKSTLWEALIWCLYGKTSRNLKATDIGNWQGKHKCFVEYCFEYKDTSYTIVRSWNPNSLRLSQNGEDLKDIEQVQLEEIIRLDFDSFLYSVIFSQFRTMFLDLKPADKSSVLSSILQLDQWEEYSDKAKSRVNWLQTLRSDTSEHVEYCKGQIKGLESVDYSQSILEWGENQRKKLENVQEELKNVVNQLKIIKEEGEKLVSNRGDFEANLEQFNTKKAQFDSDFSEIQAEIREISSEKNKLIGELGVLEREKAKFDGVEGVCPYCNQEVSEAHLEQETTKISTKIGKIQHKIAGLGSDLAEAKAISEEISSDSSKIFSEISSISYKIASINTQLTSLKRESQNILNSQTKLQVNFKQLQQEENPYIEKRDQQQLLISNLKESISKGQKDILSVDTKISSFEYWIKGFKEIRLFLISEVLTHLEVEVNNALYQLGLQDWKIEFSIDKVNKSGTVRKGFTVLIYSPYNEEPVAWESWSGGEGQRLRLAGALGLSNLILARNGAESFIEVYDEPSQFLSSKGISDLLDTLNDRARDQNKQIWVIDHRSFEYPFDGMYSIIKDKEGSRFETYD
jgi:DNA repair exonuclease SbcCD ATPase subunit